MFVYYHYQHIHRHKLLYPTLSFEKTVAMQQPAHTPSKLHYRTQRSAHLNTDDDITHSSAFAFATKRAPQHDIARTYLGDKSPPIKKSENGTLLRVHAKPTSSSVDAKVTMNLHVELPAKKTWSQEEQCNFVINALRKRAIELVEQWDGEI
jgi:hypothetical protein